jgi:HSP20 family protein
MDPAYLDANIQYGGYTMKATDSLYSLSRLFDPIAPFGTTFKPARPPIRSYDTYTDEDGSVVLEAELPGCEAEDVKIETEGNVLRIDAKHEGPRRSYSFEKEFSLGDTLDPQKVEAQLKGGILRIRLPKKKAKKNDVKLIPVAT